MNTRLTDKTVEKIKPPASGRAELHDGYLRGLSLRVTETGRKSWSVIYRVAGAGGDGRRGKLRRMTIGTYPALGLADARQRAREILIRADEGHDPANERLERLKAREERTFGAISEKFIELYSRPNVETWRTTARLLRAYAYPHWQDTMIEEIGRAQVHELLDSLIANRGVALAREVRKPISGVFNWAVDRGYLPASPVAGMRRPELAYKPRERVLSMAELGRIWDASFKVDYPFGTLARLLLLSAQRRAEIANLQSSWIRPDRECIEIPAERYKTRRVQIVPISKPMRTIIDDLPRWSGGKYLLTTTAGRRPVSGFSKNKQLLGELAQIENWTLHDLRRSAATHMARLGVAQEHIERVLGHAIAGIAGTYNRYSYLEEKRAALEKWGAEWC